MPVRLPQDPLQGAGQERSAGVFADGLGEPVPSRGALLRPQFPQIRYLGARQNGCLDNFATLRRF